MSTNVYKTVLTKEPIELIHKQKNHRVLKILQCLLWGIEVQIDDYVLRLAETENNGICLVSIINKKQKTIIGLEDAGLTWLSEKVMRIPDETYNKLLFDLAASINIIQ